MTATTTEATLREIAEELEASLPDTIPSLDDADRWDPRRLALVRFITSFTRADPRMSAARTAFDRLLKAMPEDARPYLDDALRQYVYAQIRCAAPIAVALHEWIVEQHEELGPEVLNSLWTDGEEVSDKLTRRIIDRSGVLDAEDD